MKKIFTLLTALFAVMAVNAQKITFAVDGSKTEWSSGDFKITATDTEGKIAIDENSTYFGTATEQIQYGSRLKSGGKSTSNLFLTATIPADGTLKISARTGSNSATDRNVVVTQEDKEILNKILLESEAIKVTIGDKEQNVYPVASFPVKAGSATITFPVGSVNFYAIEFVEGTGGGDTPGGEDEPTGPKEIWDAMSVKDMSNPDKKNVVLVDKISQKDIDVDGIIIHDESDVLPNGTDPSTVTHTSTKKLQMVRIEANTDNVSGYMAVCPNIGDENGAFSYGLGTNESGNNKSLDTDKFSTKFYDYLKGKSGNAVLKHTEWWEYNQEGDVTHKYDDVFWTLAETKAPAISTHIGLCSKVKGNMKVGIFVNKNIQTNPVYVLKVNDDRTYEALAPNKIKYCGYINNNTTEYYEANPDADYHVEPTLTQQNPFLGYLAFTMEENANYVIFIAKNQIGFYGYEFTPTGTTGISDIVVEKVQNDAIYNIAGQRVSGSAKGLVIKNGKKYFVK